MARLFGTDGVRGVANKELTCQMAFQLGQAAVAFKGRTILIGLASTSVCFALTPTIPALLLGSAAASAVADAVLMFFFDCGVMLFFIPYLGLRQKVTPDPMLGRMTSTMRFLTVATAPLGALAAGWVAEHFGVRNGLACIAAGSIALTIAMVWGTPLRSVRT